MLDYNTLANLPPDYVEEKAVLEAVEPEWNGDMEATEEWQAHIGQCSGCALCEA